MFDSELLIDLEIFLELHADITDEGTPNEAMQLQQKVSQVRAIVENSTGSGAYRAYRSTVPKLPRAKEMFEYAYTLGSLHTSLKFEEAGADPRGKILYRYKSAQA